MDNLGTLPKDDWEIPYDGSAHDDPLLGCLLVIAKLEHLSCTRESLVSGLPLVNNRLTPDLFVRASRRAGMSARIIKRPLDEISNLVLPAVLLLKGGRACVLERKLSKNRLQIILPESGEGAKEVALDELAQEYTGHALFTQTNYRFDERTDDNAFTRQHHWFWDTLAESRSLYGEVLLASFLINFFALASPLFIMNVYDRVVPNHATATLWVLAIGIATVYGFDLLMRTLRGYFIDIAGKRTDIILSANIFERVLGMKMESRPPSVGAFANSLHEFDSFRDFFTSATLTTLIDLPFVLFFILIIWFIGGPLAMVPLTVIPLSFATGYFIQKMLKGRVHDLLRHSAQKQATLIEVLSGLETIKSLSATSPMQRRWENVVGHISNLSLKTRFLSSSAVNLTHFFQQMATVGVVIYGVYLIIDGELSMGGLIACTILTGRALAPLGQLAATLTRYQQAMAAYKSTDSMMALPQERPTGKAFLERPQLAGAIEFKKVSFRYPQQPIDALSDLSFKINAGERVAIIGRIGSGKTTIEKLILGLYEPSSGSILIDGTDHKQIDPADLRRQIGYVQQDTFLFYGSVKDNIMMGMPHADHPAVLRAATIAGVTDFVNKHPSGFDMQVGERGEGLSGGQRQSIAVARALLREPPILIMDEPSNAMDNTTEEIFKSRFGEWIENRTLIIVTHRASLLSLVDRIIMIDGGRVIADGPKDKVLSALKQGQIKVPK